MKEKQKEEKKNIKFPNASLEEDIFFPFFNEDKKFIIWMNYMKEKTFLLLCWQYYFLRENSFCENSTGYYTGVMIFM